MILDDIVKNKIEELAETKRKAPLEEVKKKAVLQPEALNFAECLKTDRVSIIAEVKKASPSLGVIRKVFNPVEIAKIYAANGASAISVLTETKYFTGSLEYVSRIKKATHASIPILRKDFIIEPYQVYESRAAGADAILLITAILKASRLRELIHLAHELGLQCLVETHSEPEILVALDSGARIIGINNRDLSTFTVDINTTLRLSQMVPKGCLAVSESGIRTRQDIEILRRHGVKAVLIGERLMSAPDIAVALRELL
jgi:indole-3-glycerol phosphate synthase